MRLTFLHLHMGTPGYTIIAHPSDVGIEATGNSLESAFKNAAHGLLSLLVEKGDVREV